MPSERYPRRRLITFVVLVVLSGAMLMVDESRPVQELRNGVRFAMAPIQDTLSRQRTAPVTCSTSSERSVGGSERPAAPVVRSRRPRPTLRNGTGTAG